MINTFGQKISVEAMSLAEQYECVWLLGELAMLLKHLPKADTLKSLQFWEVSRIQPDPIADSDGNPLMPTELMKVKCLDRELHPYLSVALPSRDLFLQCDEDKLEFCVLDGDRWFLTSEYQTGMFEYNIEFKIVSTCYATVWAKDAEAAKAKAELAMRYDCYCATSHEVQEADIVEW